MNTEPKVLNCTPHVITQYNIEDIDFSDPRHLHLFNEEKAVPKRQWSESGVVANATKVETGGDLSFKFTYTNVSELPEGYDIYIVSFMYLDACRTLGRDISKLRTSYGAIYDKATNRTVIGCKGLSCVQLGLPCRDLIPYRA